MTVSTKLATAMSDGTLRQCCVCDDDIELDTPVAANKHGTMIHADCASGSPRPPVAKPASVVRPSAGVMPLPQRRSGYNAFGQPYGHAATSTPAPTPEDDIGDQVVASLEAQRTQLPHVRGTQPTPTPKRAPKVISGDLGDMVVAALEKQRGARPAQQANP